MNYGEIFLNLLSSLARVSVGFMIGASLGLFFAVIRFYFPDSIKRNFIFNFLIDAPKYPPPIAWIPFVILFFGIGSFSSVVLVAIGAFPPVFTQIYDGLERVNNKFMRLSDNLEIFGMNRLFGILLPAIQPEIFTGLRVGIGMGWMSIIASEMVAGQSGLGYSIQMYRLELNYFGMLISIFLIGLMGFLLQEAFTILEKKLCKWKRL